MATREEILREIMTKCVFKYQQELAEKYNVDTKDISHLLQECGFVNRKFENDDVEVALKNQKVQKICDKICRNIQVTREDILKEIMTDCVSNFQKALAEKYKVSRTDISHLLQECGFVNRKFENEEPFDVEAALKNPRVKRICDKILSSLNKTK